MVAAWYKYSEQLGEAEKRSSSGGLPLTRERTPVLPAAGVVRARKTFAARPPGVSPREVSMAGIVYAGKFEQIINDMLGPQYIAASAMKLKALESNTAPIVLESS
jgi:hypothetical protein